jgi:site-specific DNA recombinase
MTLRTKTSKSGQMHRYDACSTHGRQGKAGCVGRNIRMDVFDTLVTDHLVAELLQPDRLRATLASLWSLRAERAAEVDGRVAALRGEVSSAEDKLSRLDRMVEEDITDLDDILKERIATLKAERDRAKSALDWIHVAERMPAEIGPDVIERFGHRLRENVMRGEIPFRKAWLQAIIDRVEVGADVIRIVGDKGSLDAALAGAGGTAAPGVRSSVRRWRALRDGAPTPFNG